jgi:tetratricopeptide (TPR) repeat protein
MEDAFTYLEAGMESMDAGRYDEALISFEEGWEYFEDFNCLLFTALCYEITGQKRSYLRSLKDVDADMLEPEYRSLYMVRMGGMLIRSLDYDGAVDLLGWEELDDYSDEEQQQILYLLGTAHLGSGSDTSARKAFEQAVDLGPSSELGRRAAEALSSL